MPCLNENIPIELLPNTSSAPGTAHPTSHGAQADPQLLVEAWELLLWPFCYATAGPKGSGRLGRRLDVGVARKPIFMAVPIFPCQFLVLGRGAVFRRPFGVPIVPFFVGDVWGGNIERPAPCWKHV